jgi:acetoin utilization deacetylase AcuC-like enzyme
MYVVFDNIQQTHNPKFDIFTGKPRDFPEQPVRAEQLLAAAQQFGCKVRAPRDFGEAPIVAVHDRDYLEFLRTGHARWSKLPNASPEILPYAYAVRRARGRPSGIIGEAGYYMSGTNCPIGEGTWRAAYASAQTATEAAELVCNGEKAVYALCRPPGHHAQADMAGGFCYLNNAAIAAQRLRGQRYARIAIVDIDLHHGNGTQEIFYERGDVHFTSVHADPSKLFPFYFGYTDERGAGEGIECNLNLPLPFGSGDREVIAALGQARTEIEAFEPEALVVSLGFDAFVGDPIGAFRVTTQGFRGLGEWFGQMRLPTVLVQEGGYADASLGENLTSFLGGFTDAPKI